ncbi:MAG TPA: DUF6603 domain-containing protein [Chthoniobacter sp.]
MTLKSTVSSALQGVGFDLAASALGQGSDPVPALLAKLFPQSSLQLSGASVDTSSDHPTASGTLAGGLNGPYGFLSGMAATAVFSLDTTGMPQVQVRFIPAAGHGLPDALPCLSNSVLAAFSWSNAQYSFDTMSPAELPATFPACYNYVPNSQTVLSGLQKGMSFSAEVTYRGSSAGMEWLLGESAVTISGPVEWYGSQARFDLVSVDPATGAVTNLGSRSLAPFSLPLSLHFVGLLREIPASINPSAPVQMSSLMVFAGNFGLPSGSPSLTISFALEVFTDPPGQVVAVGQFVEGGPTPRPFALSDIAGLLGVTSLDSEQPAVNFPVLSDLALQTVALTVDTASADLVIAAATVSYMPPGGSWAPFGSDVLTFGEVDVTFRVVGPMDSPTFATSLSVTASLAGGTLDAAVDLPGLDFCCDLAEGGPPIDLTTLLNNVTNGAFGTSVVILCDRLRVLGNAAQGYYQFLATVSGGNNWSFNTLGANFALTDIAFDLTVQTGVGGNTTGGVTAQLVVANEPVQLFAKYASGEAGWTFGGGTVGETGISITDLASEAASLFGLTLPNTAPDITITDLQMMVATQNMDFGFSCEGSVEVMGTSAVIGIDLGRTHDNSAQPPQVTTTFAGFLVIGGQTFRADFTAAASGKSILFQWIDADAPLDFSDIASYFGYTLPALPENLDLGLKDAEFYYDFTNATVVASAHSSNYGQILFASLVAGSGSPNAGQRIYLFSLDVGLNVQLSELPVVGDKLPAGVQLGVRDLQIIVASAALAASDLTALNNLITGSLNDTALMPTSLGAGVTFATKVQMGSGSQPIIVPLTGGGTTPAPSPAPTMAVRAGAAAPGDTATSYQAGAKWFNIQKSFGPVQIQRIGIQYQNEKFFFLLDASLTLATLSLGMEGLGISSQLATFTPAVHIDGIGVSFSSGPVTISGGLLCVPTEQLPPHVTSEYLGELTIAVEPWMISAVASYATVSGAPSFFVFAQVDGPFGGPPAFFITGFMGGFGYNSQLTLPDPDQVYKFPFIAGFSDPTIFGSSPTPTSVLSVLAGGNGSGAWVTPMVGEDWIAAGVLFRSFELVLGKALLAVTFGRDFEVALLGLASTSLPQGETTVAYAYIELQLELIFKPEDGYFGLTASLTPNSFVLTKDCHLTGGFAFCLWFGANAHAGDFVVVVGGYHPAFAVPAYYPTVALVGYNWKVDSNLTIKGGAYFALTPSAVMAGGGLEVLYTSGCVRAWFTAYANLLIAWKPFHFTGNIGISLGAAVRVDLEFTTVTLSFDVGATLELWGPPTSGYVTVHLDVISFSIPFGASQDSNPPEPLDWSGFQTLLPQSGAAPSAPHAMRATRMAAAAPASSGPLVLGVQVNRGLSRQDSDGVWYVRADELIFTSATAVPATSFNFGSGGSPPLADGATPVAMPGTINIRPMSVTGVTSTHTITLTNIDDSKQIDLSTWTQTPQARALPEAMWGTPVPRGQRPAPSSATIGGLPVGVQLIAPPATVGKSPGAVDISSLIDPLGSGVQPLKPDVQRERIPAPRPDPHVIAAIGKSLASTQSQKLQKQLVAALAGMGAAPPTSDPFVNLMEEAGQAFSQEPLRID